MQLLQRTSRMKMTKASTEQTGLAEWLLGLLRGIRAERQPVAKQMYLLETLPLGGKRQLMLVSCAGERFLVGGGLESVETIVLVQGAVSADRTPKKLDGPCL
jgi:flagellar biogenesis protein FliO